MSREVQRKPARVEDGLSGRPAVGILLYQSLARCLFEQAIGLAPGKAELPCRVARLDALAEERHRLLQIRRSRVPPLPVGAPAVDGHPGFERVEVGADQAACLFEGDLHPEALALRVAARAMQREHGIEHVLAVAGPAQIAAARSEGIFTPPSLQGTIQYPGMVGGMNWGGISTDPTSGTIFVNDMRLGLWVQMFPQTAAQKGQSGSAGEAVQRIEASVAELSVLVESISASIAGEARTSAALLARLSLAERLFGALEKETSFAPTRPLFYSETSSTAGMAGRTKGMGGV